MNRKLLIPTMVLVSLLALPGCGYNGTAAGSQYSTRSTTSSQTNVTNPNVYNYGTRSWINRSSASYAERNSLSRSTTIGTTNDGSYYANQHGRVTAFDQKNTNQSKGLKQAENSVGEVAREPGGVTDGIL